MLRSARNVVQCQYSLIHLSMCLKSSKLCDRWTRHKPSDSCLVLQFAKQVPAHLDTAVQSQTVVRNFSTCVDDLGGQSTWKAYLHPRKAILDQAWVSQSLPNLLVSSLSLHGSTSQPGFDHTMMIMFSLLRTAAGLGYSSTLELAALWIQDYTGLLWCCRVDLEKICYPVILLEWWRPLVISLSQPEDESVKPSDHHGAKMLKLSQTSLSRWPHYTTWAGSTMFWHQRAPSYFREMNLLCAARQWAGLAEALGR